jgi:predicted small metal-binding protein
MPLKMSATFDLFRCKPDGHVCWIESAENLLSAKVRIQAIGSNAPGQYLVFSHRTGDRILIEVEATSLLNDGRQLIFDKLLSDAVEVTNANFGNSEDEVLKKADEHAKTAHNMQSMPPDVLSKVRSAIRDEGGTATKKVGA